MGKKKRSSKGRSVPQSVDVASTSSVTSGMNSTVTPESSTLLSSIFSLGRAVTPWEQPVPIKEEEGVSEIEKQLTEKIQRLTSENDRMNKSLTEARSTMTLQVASHKLMVRNLRKQIEECKQEAREVSHMCDAKDKAYNDVRSKTDELKAAVVSSEGKIKSLNDQIAFLETEKQTQQESSGNKHKEIEASLSAAKKLHADLIKKSQEEISSYQSRIESLQSEAIENKDLLKSTKEKLAEASERHDRLEQKYKDAKASVAESSESFASLKRERDAAAQKQAEMEDQINHLETNLSSKADLVKELQQKIDNSHAELSANLESLTNERDLHKEEKESALAKIAEYESSMQDAGNNILDFKAISEEKESALAKIAEYESRIKDAEMEISAFKNISEENDKIKEELSEKCRALEELEAASEGGEKLREELSEKNSALLELKTKLEKKNRELEESNREQLSKMNSASSESLDLLENVTNEKDQALQENARLSARVEELEKELGYVTDERDHLVQENQTMSPPDEVEKLKKELEDAQSTSERLIASGADLEKKVNDLTKQSISEKREWEEKAMSLENELSIKSGEVEKSQDKIKLLESFLLQAEEEKEKSVSNIKTYAETEINSLNDQIQSLEDMLEKSRAMHDEYIKVNKKMEDSMRVLTEEREHEKVELKNTLQESKSQAKAEIRALLKALEEKEDVFNEHVVTMEKKEENAKVESARLNIQLLNERGSKDHLSRMIKALEDKNQSYCNQLIAMEEKMRTSDDKCAFLNTQLLNEKRGKEDTKKILRALEKMNEGNRKQLMALEMDKARLKLESEEASRKLKAMAQEVKAKSIIVERLNGGSNLNYSDLSLDAVDLDDSQKKEVAAGMLSEFFGIFAG